MPRDLPHWTSCAPPGVATTAPIGEFVGIFLFGLLFGGTAMAIVGAVVAEAASLGCIAGAAFLTAAVLAINDIIDWYDNRRLLCIQHGVCAVGTVVTKPGVSTDGDVGLNIALAPWSPGTQVAELQALTGQSDVLTHVQSLGTSDDVVQLYQQLVHERFRDAATYDQVQMRYWVTTPDVDATNPATSTAIPNDSYVPGGPPTNPMFRGPCTEGAAPADAGHPFVYMHTEIEGHWLVDTLSNIRDGLIGATIGWIAACAVCAALGGVEPLCSIVAGLVALLLFFLIWLIEQFGTNPPYDASAPDVDVPEEFLTPASASSKGDVVVVYGDWIMDMEHDNYFEVHPVKAWYRVCGPVSSSSLITDDLERDDCSFDPATLTETEYGRICGLVRAAERDDPDASPTVDAGAGLAMFGGLRG